MAQPAILSVLGLENLLVCGVHSLCSIVDICLVTLFLGPGWAQIFRLRRSGAGDGAGLLYSHENAQDVFVQDCHNFLRPLQCCPAQQIEPEHDVAQRGYRLVVSLDKELMLAVIAIPNHKTAIAALSFFLCHAMQYRP
jgi:hypothetical protein